MEVTELQNTTVHKLPDGRYSATINKRDLSAHEVTLTCTSENPSAVMEWLSLEAMGAAENAEYIDDIPLSTEAVA